ncbi:PilN domain-containing protein [Photobacterium nomapromontoriensis]|uniref:PilN domain-containing protein n=1 Tax=Photobacterium nomapromontoriensis TaxID=2910237 RepID=UPI003D0F1F76
MIAKLNLLPWREEQKRRHKTRFFSLLAGASVCALLGVWLAGSLLIRQQEIQLSRNNQLKQEITVLEQRLSLLPELDRQRDALIQRLDVITNIQKGRNHITRLLSLLPGVVPQGVYLDDISMKGSHVRLNGVGDSNGRLATLLSNGEQSEWISNVSMHSIVVTKDKPREQTQFKASFSLLSPESVVAKGSQHQGGDGDE